MPCSCGASFSLEHADADRRVLEAAERFAARQAPWHGRLIRALRPYGDYSTSVGEALCRAAADLGGRRGRARFRRWAGAVVAAAEGNDAAAG